MTAEIDLANKEAYNLFRNIMERKRDIDGNKLEIKSEFEVLKGRLEFNSKKKHGNKP